MSEIEPTYFMFPIRNEEGFRVKDSDTYSQMIQCLILATAELVEEYPDKKILVVYEADSGMRDES